MPLSPHEIKALIANDLWLPLARKGGDQLFPQKRKHKGMKLLTLTDMDYQEIELFEENKLIRRESVVAWTPSYLQQLRLEADLGPSKVLSIGRFDDVIIDSGQEIFEALPCDLLNMDFFSQKPSNSNGRIEKEVNCENIIVRRSNELRLKGFVLFHTTLVDQTDLNITNLTFPFSVLQEFANPACSLEDKMKFIRNALDSIMQNNNYVIVESAEKLIDLGGGDKLFSVGLISMRRI